MDLEYMGIIYLGAIEIQERFTQRRRQARDLRLSGSERQCQDPLFG